MEVQEGWPPQATWATSGNLGLRLLPPPALELGRRQVVGRTMETLVVPPVDPLAGRKLDMLGRPPGPATVDQLRLVEPMDRLCDGIIEAVPPWSRPNGRRPPPPAAPCSGWTGTGWTPRSE